MSHRSGSQNLFLRGFQTAIGDIFPNTAGKQKDILLDDPDLTPQRSQRHIANIHPVNRDPPLGDLVKRGSRLQSVVFPEPLCPTNATVSPGWMWRSMWWSTFLPSA